MVHGWIVRHTPRGLRTFACSPNPPFLSSHPCKCTGCFFLFSCYNLTRTFLLLYRPQIGAPLYLNPLPLPKPSPKSRVIAAASKATVTPSSPVSTPASFIGWIFAPIRMATGLESSLPLFMPGRRLLHIRPELYWLFPEP